MSPLHFGITWSPEYWPESCWLEDIHLMKEAGVTVVQMAEFAWSKLEPSAGEFNFEWLERAITLLAEARIQTILGIPTSALPGWLIEAYPEILPVQEDGQRMQSGVHTQICTSAPEMQAASRRIVEAMAGRFGDNPHVIGWEMDNKSYCECFCDLCQARFQAFLMERFVTLGALNQAWSSACGGQIYTRWEQIPLQRSSTTFPGVCLNLDLLLEFKRFTTASARAFQKLQVDLLRPHLHPDVWISNNGTGWFDDLDYYETNLDIDLAACDITRITGHHAYLASGAAQDLTRGLKRKNFWVVETEPASLGGVGINHGLYKGEARALAWRAVGHGADALLYGQWRSTPNWPESSHGSLIDLAGQVLPFYKEVSQIGSEFQRLAGLLKDTTVKARIAMLNCCESHWATNGQRQPADFDYVAHFNHYYRHLAETNAAVDIISADCELDGFWLVIAPALFILDDRRIENLRAFVKRGGNLVLTVRTGMKNRRNAQLSAHQRQAMAELAGVEVEEYYTLEKLVPVQGNIIGRGTGKIWAENLRILDKKNTFIMSTFGACNGWLDSQPAMTVHPFGRGMVFTVGTWLDDASQEAFSRHLLRVANTYPIKTPPGVELCTRTRSSGEEVHIIINNAQENMVICLPWTIHEHLNDIHTGKEIILPPYGVAVVTKDLTPVA